jgi:hypothetical protein
MWVRMTLSLGVVAALIAALVLWVHHQTDDTPSEAQVSNPKAIAEEHREAEIVVGQDQRPHVVAFAASTAPAAEITGAVTGYMRTQVRRGLIDGSLMRSSCARAGGSDSRQLWRCTVVVANVNYPFDAVIEPAARRLTYCKRDMPPIPSMNIPVSARCR